MTTRSNPEKFVDAHRTWLKNNDFPTAQPTASIVVRPATSLDVSAAVRYAVANGIDVSVRCGGHGQGGKVLSNGGMLIDMRSYKSIEYDASTHIVTISGGTQLDEIAWYMEALNRSPPMGICPGVGLGVMHGGWGGIARLHGLFIDAVVEAEIVTADGSILTLNEHSHPDLFWAVRGDLSNYGVVTKVKLNTYDVDIDFQYVFMGLKMEDFPAACQFTFQFQPDNKNVGSIFVITGGQLYFWLWSYNGVSLQELLDDLSAAGVNPIWKIPQDGVGLGYFNYLRAFWDFSSFFPDYAYSLTKEGGFIPTGTQADNDFLEKFVTLSQNVGLGLVEMWGGAVAEVPNDATPMHARENLYMWYVGNFWYDGRQTEAQVRGTFEIFNQLIGMTGTTDSVYINHVEPSPENVVLAFRDNIPRLQQVKSAYDPMNVFHNGYAVPPK